MGARVIEVILSLSVSGTMVALLLFLLKPLTSRVLTNRFQYYIWFAVILRLLIPFAPEKNLTQALFDKVSQAVSYTGEADIPAEMTPFKTQDAWTPGETPNHNQDENLNGNLNERPNEEQVPAPSVYADGKSPADREGAGAAESPERIRQPRADRGSRAERILNILFLVWSFGALLSLAVSFVDYRNFSKYVTSNNRPVEEERVLALLDDILLELGIRRNIGIYENRLILSPLMTGVFRKMLVLPETLPKEELLQNGGLRHILTHELMHFKKRDLWYKWLFQIVLCLHWFNPVMYLVRKELNRNCELACDESVIRRYEKEERRAYGSTLLAAAESAITYKNNVMSTTLVEEKKYMKERLVMIMKWKKKTKLTAIYSTAVICAVLVFGVVAGARNYPSVQPNEKAVSNGEAGSKAEELALAMTQTGLTTAGIATLEAKETPTVSQKSKEKDKAQKDSTEKELTEEKNKAEAAKIYGDDKLIAGDDRTAEFSCWSWMNSGKGKTEIARFKFTGSMTMLCVYAAKDTSISVSFEAYQKSGKLKLVLIDPDNKVSLIGEGTVDMDTDVTLKKGRNRIKLIGSSSDVMAMTLEFGKPAEGSYSGLYYSEGEEQAALLLEKVKKGEKIDVDLFVEYACDMDDEDVAKLLTELLEKNITLTDKQLEELACYSDEDIVGDYLLKKLKDGKPAAFKTVAALAPYLDSDLVGEYLTQHLKSGNKLSSQEIKNIICYADEDMIADYVKSEIRSGTVFSKEDLSQITDYLYADQVGEIIKEMMGQKNVDSLALLKQFADDMYADDNYNCMLKLIMSGVKVTAQDIVDFKDQLYSDGLANCIEAAMDAGTVFTAADIKKIYDDIYSSDLGVILIRLLANGTTITYNDMLTFGDNLYSGDLERIVNILGDRKAITAEQKKKLLESW